MNMGMNMNVQTRSYLSLLYGAGCLAYSFYELHSYTGLFRLAAEWQMDTFGSYDEKLTLLAPLLGTLIPGIVVARLLGWEINSRETLAELTTPRALSAIGLVLLAASAGVGWYAYGKSTEKVAYEAFDLSKSKAPPSNHVVMTGVARPEYQMEFEIKRNASTTVDRYVPVTAADWRRGDPLVYFITTKAAAYTPPEGGKSFAFSRRTPPFTLKSQGVLVEGGLPGPVAEAYRKDNVALASPPVLLDSSPGADAEPYVMAAIFTGLGSLYCLGMAAVTAFRQWRQARRAQA
jgi:hypothetical protein